MIWFNSQRARQRLMTHGRVITCRVKRKLFGTSTAFFTNDQGVRCEIGKVNVVFKEETIDQGKGLAYRLHSEAMEDYLELSGFETVKKWEDEILSLNSRGKIPSYLIFLDVTLKV